MKKRPGSNCRSAFNRFRNEHRTTCLLCQIVRQISGDPVDCVVKICVIGYFPAKFLDLVRIKLPVVLFNLTILLFHEIDHKNLPGYPFLRESGFAQLLIGGFINGH